MRGNRVRWPLPRRDPDDPSRPVELLLDITFVLALQQAANFLQEGSGATSVLRAIAALSVVAFFWQSSVVPVTAASVTTMPMRLLTLVQTALFLMLAVTLPEAFGDLAGGLNGQLVFGATVTLSVAATAFLWIFAHKGYSHSYGNVAVIIVAYIVYGMGIWWSLHVQGVAQPLLMIASAVAAILIGFSTSLPLRNRWGVGANDNWCIFGARAFTERFAASYVVACCMVLELLELVAQSIAISPAMLVCVLESLLIAYILYWIYDPLVAPAQRQLDPRNPLVSRERRNTLLCCCIFGTLLMCSGLVVAAGALRGILIQITSSSAGALGPPIQGSLLIELCAGIAVCLLGQSVFSFFTTQKLYQLRMSGCLASMALLPLLMHQPALLAVTVVLLGCALLRYLDRHHRSQPPTITSAPPLHSTAVLNTKPTSL